MPLPDNPTITVNFEGLMLLAFENGLGPRKKGHCQIALIQPDARHCLKVSGIAASGRKLNIPEKIEGDITLEILGREGEGVSTHEGDASYASDHENDFHWLVDLQAARFHGKKPVRIKKKVRQSVFVHQGLFYTAEKQKVRIFRKGLLVREEEVARKIACNLYLKDGETAVFKFGGQSIELPRHPGASHTISISTLCDPSDSPDNDFQHYYDVVGVEDAMFDIRGHADNPGEPIPAGDGRAPCNPACLGRVKSAELRPAPRRASTTSRKTTKRSKK